MAHYLKLLALPILALTSTTPLLRAQCTQGNPTGCFIAPATKEINLGALPVDRYSYSFANNGTIPSCAANLSVRTCIRTILQNYNQQGATGVRILLGLGGGGHSTAFAPDGGVYTCWLDRLNDFLADAAFYGYTKVTPTPVFADYWSAVEGSPYYTDRTNVTSCGTSGKNLRFFPWLPFGLDKDNSLFPDCQGGDNNGYNSAVNNTYNFWGWNRYFRLLDFVFQKVTQNNLTIADFDMQNEVDLMNFTVLGRLIYDNKNRLNPNDPLGVDVLGTIRTKMETKFGTGAGRRATFSTAMVRPTLASANCDSYYTSGSPSVHEKAMIILQSELYSALNNDFIGTPANLNVQPSTGLLPCEGNDSTMIKLGLLYGPYSQPTVTNIHAHVCIEGSCGLASDQGGDATTVAKNLYDGVWAYLQQRGLTENKVMFGEVNHTQTGPPDSCRANYNVARAYNNVNGFQQSTLCALSGSSCTAAGASNTVLRVWQNILNSCYTVPNTIKPPYGPQ